MRFAPITDRPATESSRVYIDREDNGWKEQSTDVIYPGASPLSRTPKALCLSRVGQLKASTYRESEKDMAKHDED